MFFRVNYKIYVKNHRTYLYKILKVTLIATFCTIRYCARLTRGRTVLLTRQGLLKAKSKAVKNRVWYEALSTAERAIINLTVKCVEKVRSPTLAKAITRILSKIRTLEKSFIERAEEVGSDIAKRIVWIAQKWGNKKSSYWEIDINFIRFLGVTALNT